MKKIMFNDKYGLTQAVLEGRKTQTRRIITIPKNIQRQIVGEPKITGAKDYRLGVEVLIYDEEDDDFVPMYVEPVYLVNEVVAIAQSYGVISDNISHNPSVQKAQFYCNVMKTCYPKEEIPRDKEDIAGWSNKMFVKSKLMPHQIRITKVRIQRLQDISDVDCMAEGINYYEQEGFSWCSTGELFDTLREAYAALIDKISGKGTWESNPYVWVYEFELVKWV
jgi:hypothetical protein